MTERATSGKIGRSMRASRVPVTVSVRSVRPVVERLRALGIDPVAVLRPAGVDPTGFEDPDARIPHLAALAVWDEAVRRSGDDAFGLHTAEHIRPGAFDALDYAMRSSATLGEGLERLVRYHRILHDAARVELHRDGPQALLTHALPGGTPALPRHPAEYIVAGWLVVARQATGRDIVPAEVSFQHAQPSDVSEHHRVFRCPVRFDRPFNGLLLARDVLDVPLVRADPGLCTLLERHVHALLEKIPRTASLSDRVRQVLANEPSPNGMNAAAVAGRLHMSRRTLQRQLREDGISFQALREALLRDLAMSYLREPEIAIAEVAFVLGFSEPSAFHRAFKRWSGLTPKAYRSSAGG